MRTVLLFACLLFIMGCSKQHPEDQIKPLQGYWEIDEVTASGKKKEYGINQVIDYIHINEDLTGFRKKLVPKLDGSFEINNHQIPFTLKIENDSLHIYYNTAFDQWKESVIHVDSTSLHIQNTNGYLYTYKRHQKFDFK